MALTRRLQAIGFNVETVQVGVYSNLFGTVLLMQHSNQYKNIRFQVWDLGGQSSIRYAYLIFVFFVMEPHISFSPYWRCYFPNTSAIIYVIDSSDTARLQTSRSELLTMLSEEELSGVPLLVFCNKQDVEGALKPDAISEELGLAGGERNREWSVRGSCATKGEGLEEGLDWYVSCSKIEQLTPDDVFKARKCDTEEVMAGE
jgi:ADP-ribosylation factor-like protein 1